LITHVENEPSDPPNGRPAQPPKHWFYDWLGERGLLADAEAIAAEWGLPRRINEWTARDIAVMKNELERRYGDRRDPVGDGRRGSWGAGR